MDNNACYCAILNHICNGLSVLTYLSIRFDFKIFVGHKTFIKHRLKSLYIDDELKTNYPCKGKHQLMYSFTFKFKKNHTNNFSKKV